MNPLSGEGESMEQKCEISGTFLPSILSAGYLSAQKPFIHVDRIASFHVMIYLTRGKMYIVEDGIEYELTPDTLFFLKKGVHHWGVRECDVNTSWYYFHFDSNKGIEETLFLPEEYPMINNQEAQQSYQQKYFVLPKLLRLQPGNEVELEIQKFVELYHSSDPFKKIKLNAQLQGVLLKCFEGAWQPHAYPKLKHQTTQIIQYLEKHYREPFSMKGLSDETGFSYKYAAEIFKKQTGEQVKNYYIMLKIKKAKRLLCESDMSIGQISDYLGFGDQFYFSNVFKKNVGSSPREFRESKITRT